MTDTDAPVAERSVGGSEASNVGQRPQYAAARELPRTSKRVRAASAAAACLVSIGLIASVLVGITSTASDQPSASADATDLSSKLAAASSFLD